LHIILRQLETLMPRLVKRPETIGRQLPAGGEECGLSHRVLKSFHRLSRIAGHEKAEAIELRETLGKLAGFVFFQIPNLKIIAATPISARCDSYHNYSLDMLGQARREPQIKKQPLASAGRPLPHWPGC
jgi:hypothetical protein